MLISVDHGNIQFKAVHCIPFRKNKTENDHFFILTLVAIAEELTARGRDVRDVHRVQLAVGLPPAYFGAYV